jgi:hypothetical protein
MFVSVSPNLFFPPVPAVRNLMTLFVALAEFRLAQRPAQHIS